MFDLQCLRVIGAQRERRLISDKRSCTDASFNDHFAGTDQPEIVTGSSLWDDDCAKQVRLARDILQNSNDQINVITNRNRWIIFHAYNSEAQGSIWSKHCNSLHSFGMSQVRQAPG